MRVPSVQTAMETPLAQIECACDFLSLGMLRSRVEGYKKGPPRLGEIELDLRLDLANQAAKLFSLTAANSRKMTTLHKHTELACHAKKSWISRVKVMQWDVTLQRNIADREKEAVGFDQRQCKSLQQTFD